VENHYLVGKSGIYVVLAHNKNDAMAKVHHATIEDKVFVIPSWRVEQYLEDGYRFKSIDNFTE